MVRGAKKQKEWIEKKTSLEASIKHNAGRVFNLSGAAQRSGVEARQAETRLESFIYQYGQVNKLSKDERQRYESLNQDAVHKRQTAKSIRAKYQQAKNKIDQMKQELESLQFPTSDEEFQSSGVEILIKKSVTPWISMIKEADKGIAKFKAKRSDLLAEMGKINKASKPLDDDSLLNADVNKHFANTKGQKERSDRVQAIQDLIQQLDHTLIGKENRLEKLKKDFSTALREAVNQYTNMAAKEIAGQFEQILNTDSFYSEAFGRACNEMIQEAGASPDDVFCSVASGVPVLIKSPLQTKADLKFRMERFIESAV